MQSVEIILYVRNQQQSSHFYTALLNKIPVLDVPGMTEFRLTPECILGLMPETGIVKILGDKVPEPASGSGIPRCELYLFYEQPAELLERAVQLGATLVSPALPRDWGHTVAYCTDPDGHILAFAKKDSGA